MYKIRRQFGQKNQVVSTMQLVVNVGHQIHVTGGADIFFAAAIGLGDRAKRLAFMTLGELLIRFARFRRHRGGGGVLAREPARQFRLGARRSSQ